MSENVEARKRLVDAFNRRSLDWGRGRIRLAILLGSLAGLSVMSVSLIRSGGESLSDGWDQVPGPAPVRLTATFARARLPAPLHDLTFITTPEGPLLIGGATRKGSPSGKVDQLTANGARVIPAGTLAQPVREAAAVNLYDETLVFGGRGASTLDRVQSLIPGARAQTVAHMPSALSDPVAVNLDKVAAYLVGGVDGRTISADVLQSTDGRDFVRVGRLPMAVREAAVAGLPPQRIYVFGGELPDGRPTSAIQEYDTATRRSAVVGRLPHPLSEASAVLLDGVIYLLGGRVRGAASDRIYRFDPERNRVLPAGRLPGPIRDAAATSYFGRAYLAGGLGRGGTPLDSVIALR